MTSRDAVSYLQQTNTMNGDRLDEGMPPIFSIGKILVLAFTCQHDIAPSILPPPHPFPTTDPFISIQPNIHLTALHQFKSLPASKDVTFTVKFLPYQLYPDASKEGEDKYQWYKNTKYGSSEDRMQKYITLMTAYGRAAGIAFDFHGTVANTLDAHRLIQHYEGEKGAEVADKIVNCTSPGRFSQKPFPKPLEPLKPLITHSISIDRVKALYEQYFTCRAHPSSHSTLLTAALSASIPETDAEAFIADEHEHLSETRMLVREQASNGVDSVPYVVFEGRRRDFTLEGAKEVGEYTRAMEGVAREAV